MPKKIVQIQGRLKTNLAQEHTISLLDNKPFQIATESLQYLSRTIKNDDDIFFHFLLLFTFLVSLPLLIILLFKSERK